MKLDRRLVQQAVQEIILDYVRLLQDKSRDSGKASHQAHSYLMVPYHCGARDAYSTSAGTLLDTTSLECIDAMLTRAMEKVESRPKYTCKMKPDYLNGESCTLEHPHLAPCEHNKNT